MKLFPSPGSPDHTQFYPRTKPHSVTPGPAAGSGKRRSVRLGVL